MKKKYFSSICFVFCFLSSIIFTNILKAQTSFEEMDSNKDGKLSAVEFSGPGHVFKRFDKDDDGFITSKEAFGTPLSNQINKAMLVEQKMSFQSKAEELIYVDAHNHILVRRGRGDNVKYDYESAPNAVLENMDQAKIKLNLIMPVPRIIGQKLRLSAEDLLPIVKKYPGRFAVLGGGGSLNALIQKAIKEGQVTDAILNQFNARAKELVDKGIVGFGEMSAEHFSMNANHPYETAPPDHPLFFRLADLAAEYAIPIDIHMEAIPEEMNLPPWLKSSLNPKTLKPNIAAFERLLAHNRKANIIWAHLGWDNTRKRTVALTRKLLSENPNLYMSIRIAGGMALKKANHITFPLDQKGNIKQEWLELFVEFSDRFIIGSDEIVRVRKIHPSSGSILATVSMLEKLPDELRNKIGYHNAYRLYKLEKKLRPK